MSPMSTDGINICIDRSIDIDFFEDDFSAFSSWWGAFRRNIYQLDLTTAINFSIPTMTVTASKGIIATEIAALNQENTLYKY